MCVGVCMGMCVGDVCGCVYGHVCQCKGMSGVIICEGSKYILKVSSLLYLYEPYFCKTVKQVESGGVVKSGSFKSTSSWLKPATF